MGRESTATRISRMTMTPPATATLSRLKRDQAIWPSERPSICPFSAPTSTASGCASAADPVVSIGAVTVTRPLSPVVTGLRPPLSAAWFTCTPSGDRR